MRESKARLAIALLVTVALFTLLLSRSMNRSPNHDEHQFVTPSILLVRYGLLPYRDYPYFHMPNQVYLYAVLNSWTSNKLLAARIVQTACGTVTVLLVCVVAWSTLAGMNPVSRWVTTTGLALVLISSRVFVHTNGLAWNHDSSTLCAVAATLLHLRGLERPSAMTQAASGALLGFAIGIRLIFAPVVAAFVGSFWCSQSLRGTRPRLVSFLTWVFGATIGLIPAAIALVSSPAQFIFGNVTYPRIHAALQFDSGAPTTIGAKALYFIVIFVDEPQVAVLLALLLYSLIVAAWRIRAWKGGARDAALLTAGILLALVPGMLAPTPVQRQYAYPLLPFMILTVVYIGAGERERWAPLRTRWLGAVLILVGVNGLPGRYEVQDLIALMAPSKWTPVRTYIIGERVKAATGPDALVLTTTPLLPAEVGLMVYPEFTTGPFAWRIADRVAANERARYHIVSSQELPGLLISRPPDALFFDRPSEAIQQFVDYAMVRGFRSAGPADGSFVLLVRPGLLPSEYNREDG